ncbi:hypothetical protein P7K49_022003 [Saguinus oedipus]|uniref:Uncharacterized protein n=1 Tax=Saguinus oedipus TaxID=9490 RepID=A0ABQ9UU97_SAGOE|nr:hypothetical protein P7K49_022003 [Saguinus oedipus]
MEKRSCPNCRDNAAESIAVDQLGERHTAVSQGNWSSAALHQRKHLEAEVEHATEIRNGNLKAILGLFFSLSRYKQQQQQPQKQHLSSPLPPAVSQVAGAPSQCQAGTPQQQVPAAPQAPCQPHQPAPHQQSKAQAEMQSRWGSLPTDGFDF